MSTGESNVRCGAGHGSSFPFASLVFCAFLLSSYYSEHTTITVNVYNVGFAAAITYCHSMEQKVMSAILVFV